MAKNACKKSLHLYQRFAYPGNPVVATEQNTFSIIKFLEFESEEEGGKLRQTLLISALKTNGWMINYDAQVMNISTLKLATWDCIKIEHSKNDHQMKKRKEQKKMEREKNNNRICFYTQKLPRVSSDHLRK